jgi:hypothetical protein
MNTAYRPVVEVLGDTRVLMARRDRGVWSLHDTNTNILAIAQGRFKAPPLQSDMRKETRSVRFLLDS